MPEQYTFQILEAAIDDLTEISGRIGIERSAAAAENWLQAWQLHIEALRIFPNAFSRYGGSRSYRKLVFDPYLVVFRVHETDEKVIICRVVHGARLSSNIGPIEVAE